MVEHFEESMRFLRRIYFKLLTLLQKALATGISSSATTQQHHAARLRFLRFLSYALVPSVIVEGKQTLKTLELKSLLYNFIILLECIKHDVQ